MFKLFVIANSNECDRKDDQGQDRSGMKNERQSQSGCLKNTNGIKHRDQRRS
ncbi:MAG TPA: hypothetical protein VFS76_17100 [Pyrinomonadaceae bacterium]|nr:hypothetical protein [Pyrinomonadaceae bacterium]